MTATIAFERLFFAVFGQTSPDDINSLRHTRPEWTENLFKLVYGIYMLVSVIVLINLLIAMMSDTYQRIQVIILSVFFSLVPCLIPPCLLKTKSKINFVKFSSSQPPPIITISPIEPHHLL
jgi:Ion transport protein